MIYIMVFNFELLAIAILLVWLIVLSVFFWQLFAHYNSLTKGANGKTLHAVLEDLLKNLKIARSDIDDLASRCDKIEKNAVFHIQKIGLLRFNPFKDTGGDQSFVLVLVDGNDTGVVVSGIYSRLGTRWYAKKIINGKGIEYELSEEEKRALKEAKSQESI